MISVSDVMEDVPIRCPHCSAALANWTGNGFYGLQSSTMYNDGDTVPFKQPAEPADIANCNAVDVGSCPVCQKGYIGLEAHFVIGQPDLQFVTHYFFDNTDCHDVARYYHASRGKRSWRLTVWETPLGPVLQHEFGPLAWEDQSWVGPSGVARCSPENGAAPWAFAARVLHVLWPELTALQQEWHAKIAARPRDLG